MRRRSREWGAEQWAYVARWRTAAVPHLNTTYRTVTNAEAESGCKRNLHVYLNSNANKVEKNVHDNGMRYISFFAQCEYEGGEQKKCFKVRQTMMC